MNANEFVKLVGLTEAKRIIRDNKIEGRYRHLNVCHVDLMELYEIVESHELVEFYGGLEQAKEHAVNVEMGVVELSSREWGLLGAIADVESCMGVSSGSN